MFAKQIKRWVRSGAVGTALTLAVFTPADVIASDVGSHVGVGVLAGDAPGLDDGYVHIGGFVPIAQPNDESLLFLDGSLLLYNEGSDAIGGNLGIGYRSFSYTTGTVLGGYVYYDRRETGLLDYNQVGFGFESLGKTFDARLNINVPIGQESAFSAQELALASTGLAVQGISYNALTTVDGEIGALLAEDNDVQLRAFAGIYGLFDGAIDDTIGVKGRLEARINDQCYLGGYISRDDQFDTTGGFTFEYRFGLKGNRLVRSGHPISRLGDSVYRRKHIVIAEQEASVVATSGGTVIELAIVNTAGTGTPDGSLETPFTTLADVATSTADVVYVVGSYTGESITVNQVGQQLLSGAQDQVITTDQGTLTLAASGATSINNAVGDAIVVTVNDVSVVGFEINNAGSDGIRVETNLTGVTIQDNTIVGGVYGIHFGGTFGLDAPGNMSGSIVGNTVAGGSFDGIFVLGDFTGNISENAVSSVVGSGISVTNVVGDIAGNTVNNNGSAGLRIAGSVTGSVTDNVVNNNGSTGIAIVNGITNDLTGNTANGNGGNGIFILSGGVGGTNSSNTATGNSASDIDISL